MKRAPVDLGPGERTARAVVGLAAAPVGVNLLASGGGALPMPALALLVAAATALAISGVTGVAPRRRARRSRAPDVASDSGPGRSRLVAIGERTPARTGRS